MRSLLLLLATLLAAACLAHGAEPTSPRRSLTFLDLMPTGPRSESDKDKCIKSMLALGLCKHHLLLASFFTERAVPPACCRAADEVDDHCGPFTRAFFRSLLPRGMFQRCARQVTVHAPTARSSSRRAPPRAPPLATVPRVSGGARAPPVPEAQTSARLPPPRATRVSGAVPHPIAGSTSAYLPPPYPVTVPIGKYTPPSPPKVVGSGPYAPVVSGGPRAAGAPRSSAVPVNEEAPRPKVIVAGGSAGGRMRRAPAGVYGPATGAPVAAVSVPPKGAVENAGGSASGKTRGAPGVYGPATDYGARMGTLYPKILQ